MFDKEQWIDTENKNTFGVDGLNYHDVTLYQVSFQLPLNFSSKNSESYFLSLSLISPSVFEDNFFSLCVVFLHSPMYETFSTTFLNLAKCCVFASIVQMYRHIFHTQCAVNVPMYHTRHHYPTTLWNLDIYPPSSPSCLTWLVPWMAGLDGGFSGMEIL